MSVNSFKKEDYFQSRPCLAEARGTVKRTVTTIPSNSEPGRLVSLPSLLKLATSDRLICRVLSGHRQVLAGAVDLSASDVVRSVWQLGKLCGDGYCIRSVIEVARDLKALDCFELMIEYKRQRIVGFDVVLDHEGDDPRSSACLKRDVAGLKGSLQSVWIRLGVLLREITNIATVVLELGRFLGYYVLFESAAARRRGLRAADFCLLQSARTHADLEVLLFLDLSLDTDDLLFLPGVTSECLLVGRRGHFNFSEFLLQFRTLRMKRYGGNKERGGDGDQGEHGRRRISERVLNILTFSPGLGSLFGLFVVRV